jgi:hypothetical protein
MPYDNFLPISLYQEELIEEVREVVLPATTVLDAEELVKEHFAHLAEVILVEARGLNHLEVQVRSRPDAGILCIICKISAT